MLGLSFFCGRVERILRVVSFAAFMASILILFRTRFHVRELNLQTDMEAALNGKTTEMVEVFTSYDPLRNVDWNKLFGTARPQIDWKTADVDSMTIRQIFEYLKWSNEDSCEFSQFFGGILNRTIRIGQKAVSEIQSLKCLNLLNLSNIFRSASIMK